MDNKEKKSQSESYSEEKEKRDYQAWREKLRQEAELRKKGQEMSDAAKRLSRDQKK
jgi:hypothetical protein